MREREKEKHTPGIPQLYRMAWLGDHELQVDGCRGIIRYDTDAICLRVGGAVMNITGRSLTISAMTGGEMTIHGTIDGIERIS